MQSTTILKAFTYKSGNGLWCYVHIMLIFECRHVHSREHCTNVFPAYALAYQYVMLDTRRPQRSSVFCLSDVQADKAV